MARKFMVVFAAGIFSALIATIISAFLLTVYMLFLSHFPIAVRDVVRIPAFMFRLCAFTAPFASSFGLVAGWVLSTWLILRRSSIRSTAHLVIECATVGVLLSLTFPMFHYEFHKFALVLWRTGRISDEALRYLVAWPGFFLPRSKESVFAVAVGLPCSVLVGIVLGRLSRRPTKRAESLV